MEIYRARSFTVIHWKLIGEFIEPNWAKMGTEIAPTLFWRVKKGGVFGYIRDEALLDHKWSYVCDSNKVAHFSEVNGPETNVVVLDEFRPGCTE